MKGIVFDASVHFGQFLLNAESSRLGCKKAQASLSTKPDNKVTGVITFNENSWVDDIIWGLDRDTQDIFYRFMDRFHSLKSIDRIPLLVKDADFAITLSQQLSISISCALSCAVSVRLKASELQSLYPELQSENIKTFFAKNHGLNIVSPQSNTEETYPEPELEQTYQEVSGVFKAHAVSVSDLLYSKFKSLQK